MKKEKGKPAAVKREPEIDLDLLENALDFISNSLDPILNPDLESGVKYSVLHLHAGVELIFRHLLFKEHWTLIFQNIDAAEKGQLITGDFYGVNSKTALARLNKICGIHLEPSALQSLEELRKKRNTIEHFTFAPNPVALKSIVSEVLVEILDLIEEYIEVPRKRGIADDLKNIQEKSLDFKEFTQKKIAKLQPQLIRLEEKGEILTCPNCFQNAFAFNEDFECLFCKYTDTPEKVVTNYIENVLKISRFYEEQDGGYFPLENCPECLAHTLLVGDDNYVCFTCLTKWDSQSLDRCVRCNELFVSEREGGTLCSDCWEGIVNSKD